MVGCVFSMFLLSAVQEPPDEIRDLLDALRSNSIFEREAAENTLVALGEAARPRVVALLKDADPEVKTRATEIVRRIDRSLRIQALVRKGAIPEALLRRDPDLIDQIVSDRREDRLEALKTVTAVEVEEPFLHRKYDLSPRFRRLLIEEFLPEIEEMFRSGAWIPNPALMERLDNSALRSMLLTWLAGKDSALRKVAAHVCWAFRVEGASPLLATLLDDHDPEIVALAVLALGHSRDGGKYGDRLISLLEEHRSGVVRIQVTLALARMDRPDLASHIVRIARDHASMREGAVKVLDRWEAGGEEFWRQMLRDGNELVRLQAVRGLGRASSAGSLDEIVRRLEDPNEAEEVIEEAARCLVRRGASGAAGSIEGALDQSMDPAVARRLVYCIRDLAGKDAEARFRRLLAHSNEDVRSAALDSIGDLHLHGLVDEVVRELEKSRSAASAGALLWLDYRDSPRLRNLLPKLEEAAHTLVAHKIVRIEKATPRGLADPDPEIRRAALALAARDGTLSKKLAISALSDESPNVRAVAAWSMRRMGWHDSGAAVADRLAVETDRQVKRELLGTAGVLRLPECQSAALRLLTDAKVRDEAILAYAAINPEGARVELRTRLGDPGSCILMAIAEAGDREFLPVLRELVELQGGGTPGLLAAEAIVHIECRQDASRLTAFLEDEDEVVRRAAVRHAEEIDAPRSLLVDRLQDPSCDVADEALRALVERGDRSRRVLGRVREDLTSRRSLPLERLNALIDRGLCKELLGSDDEPGTISADTPDDIMGLLLSLKGIEGRVACTFRRGDEKSPFGAAILETGFVRLEDPDEARGFWIDWIDRRLKE